MAEVMGYNFGNFSSVFRHLIRTYILFYFSFAKKFGGWV